MANRAKRLKKELALLEVENQFRGRFKKEKVKRKEGLKPTLLLLVNATSEDDFQNCAFKKLCIAIFLLMKKLEWKDKNAHQTFVQILQYPRPLFNGYTVYLRILEILFELETCRSFDTWVRPKSKDGVVIFKSIFYHLFVKYKIPNCLDKVLKDYCYSSQAMFQFGLLNHMVKGKGLHHFPKLLFKVNSKVNHHFFNAPVQLNVAKAIWWATLRGKQVPYSLALKMVHELSDIGVYTQWYEWLDELIFFLNRFNDISEKDLKSVMEFFIAQKSGNTCVNISGVQEPIDVVPLYPNFQLKGRSVASVLRFCEEWKKYINLIKATGSGGDFQPSKVQPFRLHHGKTLVLIKQIKNVKSLIKEGKTMSHCVATYAGECASGQSSIWMMKLHLPTKKIKKALTIEILEKEKTINEALGKCNRSATDLENKWLEAWAEREGLNCDWK